jgi:hypothetical protein
MYLSTKNMLPNIFGQESFRCNKTDVQLKLNAVDLVRKRNIPTELPALVDEVSADFCG